MELLYRGSVKDVLRHSPGKLAFRFRDTFSVFDRGEHPQEIKGKGVNIVTCAVCSFQLAKKLGIDTHFIEQLDQRTILVREAMTPFIENQEGTDLMPDVLPLELIARRRVAGSLLRDFKSGKKKPADYGFLTDDVPVEGTPLPKPVHQTTTKFEKIDRPLTGPQANDLAKITFDELEQIWAIVDRLDDGLCALWERAGFAYFDGKKEFLMTQGRTLVVGDVFGTQDEDRPVLLSALEQGKVEHYGKEFLREHFIKIGYYDALQKARAEQLPDPPYPLLPQDVLDEASRRYHEVAYRLSQLTLAA